MNQEQTTLPAEGLVDTSTVLKYLNLSSSTWVKYLRSGKVKKPVKFGRTNRFDVGYIRQLGETGIQ